MMKIRTGDTVRVVDLSNYRPESRPKLPTLGIVKRIASSFYCTVEIKGQEYEVYDYGIAKSGI